MIYIHINVLTVRLRSAPNGKFVIKKKLWFAMKNWAGYIFFKYILITYRYI